MNCTIYTVNTNTINGPYSKPLQSMSLTDYKDDNGKLSGLNP
jgi:hypothetical protein